MGVAINPKAPAALGGLGRLLKDCGGLDGLEGVKAEDTPGGGTVTAEGAAGLIAPGTRADGWGQWEGTLGGELVNSAQLFLSMWP